MAAVPSGALAGLTAGDIDDNLNFDMYLDYQSTPFGPGNWNTMPSLDLSDRVTVRIVDENGVRVPNAAVTIVPDGADQSAVTLRAGNDGVLRLFPSFDGFGGYANFSLTIADSAGEAQPVSTRLQLQDLGASRELTVTVTGANTTLPPALDIMFVIDTTGSMQDEINYLRDEFINITDTIVAGHQGVSLRFGLLVYRDSNDVYITKTYGFTDSASTMLAWLKEQSASGGGDYPEAMDRAVSEAFGHSWRAGNVARALFLVADAPPHEAGYSPMIGALRSARADGIHVFPLAASGTNDVAEYLMRSSALLTQGRHLFLTDDSGLGSAHAEPSTQCYIVTPLAGLITRVVDGELRGTRVEPAASEIIRTVGNYTEGRCDTGGGSIRPTVALSPPSPMPDPTTTPPPESTKPAPTPPSPVYVEAPGRVTADYLGPAVSGDGSDDMDGGPYTFSTSATREARMEIDLVEGPRLSPLPPPDGAAAAPSGQSPGGATTSSSVNAGQAAAVAQAASLVLAMAAMGLLLLVSPGQWGLALGLSPTARRGKLP